MQSPGESERVMGTIKLVFGVFVIAASVYLGATLVPVYYANYQFQDVIKTEATLQTYTTKPEADIQAAIYKKAQELEIPVTKEQIKVQRHGTTGTGSLTIQAPYSVHVDIPGYPLDLHFDPSTENKSPF
jgi:YbbR domain-containing protein